MKSSQQGVKPFAGTGRGTVGGVVIALLASATFAWAQSDVKKDQPQPPRDRKMDKRGPMGPTRGSFGKPGDPLDGLSEEDKKRVRQVLAKVWQDPALMAAKENVRISTDEYREVLKKAVMRVDPKIAELMKQLHENSRSAEIRKQFDHEMGRGGPGRPGGSKGPGRYGNGGDLPEFFRVLDDEKKKIFLDAREQAQKSEAMLGLRKKMEELETQESEAREARFKLRMRMGRAMREEMIRIDPRIAEFVPESPQLPSARPQGQPKPQGTDRPQRPKAE